MGGPTRCASLAPISLLLALAARGGRRGAAILPEPPKRDAGDHRRRLGELLRTRPDRQAARRPRPGRDAARPGTARADRGRRPAARQRRGPGLDHLRRLRAAALRRHAATTSTRRSPRGSCSRRARRRNSGFLPLSESRSVLCKQRRPNRNHHCTLAIPNTETPITRPRRPALPADRLLRQPDRRRPEQEGEARQRRRPRRRPARRLGRAGQGPAQRGPGARRRAGPEPSAPATRWSTPSCR